jgi:hypothetical protein
VVSDGTIGHAESPGEEEAAAQVTEGIASAS